MIRLYPHQKEALDKLRNGSILSAGVGTGKSMTALAYFYIKECGGAICADGSLSPPKQLKDLYIITTARKRDDKEWDAECANFDLYVDPKKSIYRIKVVIDSWNNIDKYVKSSEQAFYIFDEQRVVGSGVWVKSFIKIARKNRWILLTATPGDTWSDYIPIFIANGFYKNRTEFLELHAVYSRYSKFPKIDRYIGCSRLERLRRDVTVLMECQKHTNRQQVIVTTEYDRDLYRRVAIDRWNPFKNEPIQDSSGVGYLSRKVVNSDPSRIDAVRDILKKHPKVIIFYSFDYELEILRTLGADTIVAEYNGHKHQPVPSGLTWAYLVQYSSGAEAWNCTTTDTIIFYSQNYSYKILEQASGRIDRMNTKYTDLYYYHLRSNAPIDRGIKRALMMKKTFNERAFFEKRSSR